MLARATRAVARERTTDAPSWLPAEDHDQIRDVARGFAEERLMPIAGETAASTSSPPVVEQLAESGFMGMMVSEEDNGGGMDAIAAVALEEASALVCFLKRSHHVVALYIARP